MRGILDAQLRMTRRRTVTIPCLMLLAAAACASTTEAPRPASRAEIAQRQAAMEAGMLGHERLADGVRDAVERGDVERAKLEAEKLSRAPWSGMNQPIWLEKVGMIREAADQMTGARDLREAARDVGIIARVCGSCHTEYGRRDVDVQVEEQKAASERASMLQHQWATERLWDGLVVPSEMAWHAGAEVLSRDPLILTQATDGGPPARRVRELSALVHDLGRRAVETEDTAGRAELFGQLLATCAECHVWLGGGPPSP